ncbi:hypothetical protein [Mycobacterium sp.]|uniref:phage scaffolding protein n=1 Tax=Mycobacterium sp. TaxID=1785 RepID=UPI003A87B849
MPEEKDPDLAPRNQTGKVEFTAEQHEEINRIVARNNAETERKARRTEREEINAYLTDEKNRIDRAELDEIDRLKEENTELSLRVKEAEVAAKTTAARSKATSALLGANLQPGNLDDALRLIDLDAENLEDEAKALAERLPALFADNTPPPSAPSPHTSPAGRGGSNEKSAQERARERFKARQLS